MNQNIEDVAESIRHLHKGSTTTARIEDVILTITKNERYDMVFEVTFQYQGRSRHIPYTNYNNNQFVNMAYEHIHLIKNHKSNQIQVIDSDDVETLAKHIPIQMALSDENLIEVFEQLEFIIRTDVAREFIKNKPPSFFELPKEIQNQHIKEATIARTICTLNTNIIDFMEKYPKAIQTKNVKESLNNYIESLVNKRLTIQVDDCN